MPVTCCDHSYTRFGLEKVCFWERRLSTMEQMNPNYLVDDKRITEIIEALSTIEDLKGLTQEEFTWLAIHGNERFGNDGDLIFSQGTPPHHLMFILRGGVLVHRHSSSPVSVLIGQTGRITGKTPFSRIKAWNADGRSSGETWILEIHDSHFPDLLKAIPSMTQRIVSVLLDRNREYTEPKSKSASWPPLIGSRQTSLTS